MIHNPIHIESLQQYIREHWQDKIPYDKLMNAWIRERGILIQDADTVDYYMALIPMIERRLAADAVLQNKFTRGRFL